MADQHMISIRGLTMSEQSARDLLGWLMDCPDGLFKKMFQLERSDSQARALSVARPRDHKTEEILPWEYRCAEKEQSTGMAIAYDNVLNLEALLRQELGLTED